MSKERQTIAVNPEYEKIVNELVNKYKQKFINGTIEKKELEEIDNAIMSKIPAGAGERIAACNLFTSKIADTDTAKAKLANNLEKINTILMSIDLEKVRNDYTQFLRGSGSEIARAFLVYELSLEPNFQGEISNIHNKLKENFKNEEEIDKLIEKNREAKKSGKFVNKKTKEENEAEAKAKQEMDRIKSNYKIDYVPSDSLLTRFEKIGLPKANIGTSFLFNICKYELKNKISNDSTIKNNLKTKLKNLGDEITILDEEKLSEATKNYHPADKQASKDFSSVNTPNPQTNVTNKKTSAGEKSVNSQENKNPSALNTTIKSIKNVFSSKKGNTTDNTNRKKSASTKSIGSQENRNPSVFKSTVKSIRGAFVKPETKKQNVSIEQKNISTKTEKETEPFKKASAVEDNLDYINTKKEPLLEVYTKSVSKKANKFGSYEIQGFLGRLFDDLKPEQLNDEAIKCFNELVTIASGDKTEISQADNTNIEIWYKNSDKIINKLIIDDKGNLNSDILSALEKGLDKKDFDEFSNYYENNKNIVINAIKASIRHSIIGEFTLKMIQENKYGQDGIGNKINIKIQNILKENAENEKKIENKSDSIATPPSIGPEVKSPNIGDDSKLSEKAHSELNAMFEAMDIGKPKVDDDNSKLTNEALDELNKTFEAMGIHRPAANEEIDAPKPTMESNEILNNIDMDIKKPEMNSNDMLNKLGHASESNKANFDKTKNIIDDLDNLINEFEKENKPTKEKNIPEKVSKEKSNSSKNERELDKLLAEIEQGTTSNKEKLNSDKERCKKQLEKVNDDSIKNALIKKLDEAIEKNIELPKEETLTEFTNKLNENPKCTMKEYYNLLKSFEPALTIFTLSYHEFPHPNASVSYSELPDEIAQASREAAEENFQKKLAEQRSMRRETPAVVQQSNVKMGANRANVDEKKTSLSLLRRTTNLITGTTSLKNEISKKVKDYFSIEEKIKKVGDNSHKISSDFLVSLIDTAGEIRGYCYNNSESIKKGEKKILAGLGDLFKLHEPTLSIVEKFIELNNKQVLTPQERTFLEDLKKISDKYKEQTQHEKDQISSEENKDKKTEKIALYIQKEQEITKKLLPEIHKLEVPSTPSTREKLTETQRPQLK